jgi:hypothetical protein
MNETDPEEQAFSKKRIRPTSPGPINKRVKRPWKGIFLVKYPIKIDFLFIFLLFIIY